MCVIKSNSLPPPTRQPIDYFHQFSRGELNKLINRVRGRATPFSVFRRILIERERRRPEFRELLFRETRKALLYVKVYNRSRNFVDENIKKSNLLSWKFHAVARRQHI
jgi:hypothetical protein